MVHALRILILNERCLCTSSLGSLLSIPHLLALAPSLPLQTSCVDIVLALSVLTHDDVE